MLSSHLHLNFTNCFFHSDLPTKILYAPFLSPFIVYLKAVWVGTNTINYDIGSVNDNKIQGGSNMTGTDCV
jgi:hypothetical protein